VAYSGAHDATIASVVSGKVDAAALDITVWRKFVAENKVDTKAVDVFYTTPPYYNYNWSVHADMPAELREKVKKALLDSTRPRPKARRSCSSTAPRATSRLRPRTTRAWKPPARSAGLI
jgi:phosphonate transport system substrate-binding protein